MTEQQQVGSFDPETHTAGGFMDDADVTIVGAEVREFDYQGQTKPVCALAVTFRRDDAEEGDDDRTEYYKIGTLDKFTPSADRKQYLPVGTTTAMNKKCKCSLFLQALKTAGFQMSKLGTAEGIGGLTGTHAHVNIAPLPDFTTEGGEVKKDNKILIITKILDTPSPTMGKKGVGGRKKAAEAAASSPATTATSTPAAAASVDGAEGEAIGVVLAILAEKNGKVSKTLLPGEVFKRITDTKVRNAVISLVGNGVWLADGDRPWQFDGGTLSLG